jgi:hypothetical protein
MTDQRNKDIDAMLQRRQRGLIDFSEATNELITLGVKIGHSEDGDITIPDSYDKYIDKYNASNLEFEWEVEYTNGEKLRQFDDVNGTPVQYHFGNIDQSRLKNISFISNFIWPTDNMEKRIIVRLNWETGLFEILNGFAPQETMAHATMNPLAGEKKLILFARKRHTSMMGDMKSDLYPFTDEYFIYNRFVIGYQIVGSSDQKSVIIEPNGTIKIFRN